MSKDLHPTTRDMADQFTPEADYSDPGGDDFEALARDRVPIRSLQVSDLEAVVAIDRHITGRDRTAYYRRRFDEVFRGSGVRVSLLAERDGQVMGFVMARVDYGEFGRTEAEAVMDTIGIDPAFGGRGVGRALISQLLHNLHSLRVEHVRTEVPWDEFEFNRFLGALGFRPSQRLVLSLPVR